MKIPQSASTKKSFLPSHSKSVLIDIPQEMVYNEGKSHLTGKIHSIQKGESS
jgi:hypothetical protein